MSDFKKSVFKYGQTYKNYTNVKQALGVYLWILLFMSVCQHSH